MVMAEAPGRQPSPIPIKKTASILWIRATSWSRLIASMAALPISTWESTDRSRTAASAGGDRGLEEAEVERLRALGYLR